MSRILVIDDSELVNNLLKEELTQAGFDIAQAFDANQGYATALEFHPDLILLDVQLPDIQGFDLIRVIKNRDQLRHVPIIMITGTHHQTDHKVKAFQAGADDYVLKPFEMPELLERIRAVLRRSQQPMTKTSPAMPAKAGIQNWTEASTEVKPKPVSSPSTEANDGQGKKVLTLTETLYRTLVSPETVSVISLPPLTMPYLAALLGLSLGGWTLSAGSTVKPALIGLGEAGFWGLCVAFLVMACSIMGVSLTWKEGARLVCIAGLPLLLKRLGGFVAAATTAMSPFYFTASPALFFKSASFWLQRLDLFELWMLWLVWILVRQCRGSSKQKAWVTVAVIWPILGYWQSLWKH